MNVSKEINVMRTDTRKPGVEWCNEAVKNADIIKYIDNYFYRTESGFNYAWFHNIALFPNSVNFNRIIVTMNSSDFSYDTKRLSFLES